MSDKYIKPLYNEICKFLDGEYKIILESNRNLNEEWIEYDSVKWEMEENIENLVNSLKKDFTISLEKKILIIYNYICLNYIYDANVLFFFRKDKSDPENIKHIPADWYGRIVGQEWIENRKKHNRRICYEFARFYSKAINELLDGNDKLEACMVGNIDNTHYVVAITGEKYSAILDLDDFHSIKDLTRLKLGLTISGIKILRDNKKELQKVLEEFNKNRTVELNEIENAKENYIKGKINIIQYFQTVLNILNTYNIDSQGIFEYMRTIVEKQGIEIEKIWKEINSKSEKRYERCFTFEYKEQIYVMDSVEKVLSIVNNKYLKEKFVFNPIEKEYQYFGA